MARMGVIVCPAWGIPLPDKLFIDYELYLTDYEFL